LRSCSAPPLMGHRSPWRAPATSRSRTRSTRGRCAARPADPRALGRHDLLFSVGGATSSRSPCPRRRPDAARARRVPPRRRFLGARQALPRAVAILGDRRRRSPTWPRRCARNSAPRASGGGGAARGPGRDPGRAARGSCPRARRRRQAASRSARCGVRALAETVAERRRGSSSTSHFSPRDAACDRDLGASYSRCRDPKSFFSLRGGGIGWGCGGAQPRRALSERALLRALVECRNGDTRDRSTITAGSLWTRRPAPPRAGPRPLRPASRP